MLRLNPYFEEASGRLDLVHRMRLFLIWQFYRTLRKNARIRSIAGAADIIYTSISIHILHLLDFILNFI